MPQIPRYPENLAAREILHMIKDLRGRFDDLDEELVERSGSIRSTTSRSRRSPAGTASG
jgi:hypothetical protein